MKSHVAIHAASLLHNLKLFRRLAGAPVMFVVKANAYGHGLREIVGIARGSPDVGSYAVDALEEARAVRAVDALRPVLVLGWTDRDEIEELVAGGFETVVPSEEHLRWLQAAALKTRSRALVHVKIETGTNRLGLDPERAVALLAALDRSRVELRGIYSHFANIEDTTDPAYARRQLELYRSVLRRVGGSRFCRHFSCSAATLLFPETHFDTARIGISAYGYWPSKQTHALFLEKNKGDLGLRPVLSWHSKVAQVKHLDKGAAIGYGLTYKTFTRTRIIIVPVGYYDGYDRKLSNASQVLVKGVKAPVRGRVCMNMLMADVSHIPGIKVGDPVTLIGGRGSERIDADMLADWCGTINYEVLARLNPLLPRVVT